MRLEERVLIYAGFWGLKGHDWVLASPKAMSWTVESPGQVCIGVREILEGEDHECPKGPAVLAV